MGSSAQNPYFKCYGWLSAFQQPVTRIASRWRGSRFWHHCTYADGRSKSLMWTGQCCVLCIRYANEPGHKLDALGLSAIGSAGGSRITIYEPNRRVCFLGPDKSATRVGGGSRPPHAYPKAE